MAEDYYTRYTQTSYAGRKLLEQYSLSEEGVWKINGEDPNCDFGGQHHQPYLGTLQGKLEDVIREAVDMPSFWQWGAGGSIEKVVVKKVNPDTTAKRKALESKIAELEKTLAGHKEKLAAL